MPLIYGAVTKGPTILAEYSIYSGNFGSVAKDYLSKYQRGNGKYTYNVDTHVFSFLVQNAFTFVAVSDEHTQKSLAMAYLDKVSGEFDAKYAEKAETCKEYALNGSYGKKLKEGMEHITQFPEEYSKISSVQKKVDEVKNIMSDNIEKVLQRGEKLDTLVDKTDNLMFEADRFQKSGRTLRNKMWWQNCKMKLVLVFVFILLAVIIFLLVCFSGQNCLAKKQKKTL